jgi:chromosome segregation ATPase
MTKEEIREEAERIVYGMGYDTFEADGHSDFAVEHILAKTLEPKEKRIEELEEENAELEKQHKIEKEKWYAEYTAMYSDFQKHIEELEKENGTLKERCDILDESLITSTKNNIERQKIIDEHNDQLTKAKELLSRLKFDFKNFAFEVGITPVSETYFEVEKFLKESE